MGIKQNILHVKKYGGINIIFGNDVESLYIIIITMMFCIFA